MKKTNKILRVIGLMAIIGLVTAEASTTGTSTSAHQGLTASGTEAKGLVSSVIQSFKWALAFIPIWSGWYFAGKMKEYLENKEEQGQYEPKAQKNFKIVGAVVVGIIAAYLIIGILAKVFLDLSFADSWQKIVVDTWKALFGV